LRFREFIQEARVKKSQLVHPHEENIAGQMKGSIEDGYDWPKAVANAMRMHAINRDVAVEIFKRRFGVHPSSHQEKVQRGTRRDAPGREPDDGIS
jgi:hypothetical protein